MVKLNSTTAILSDLDGVILDLSYDIKFWESWLPEHMARKLNLSEEEAKSEILTKIEMQKGTLNFYDLNYWDDLLDVDCMQIIKAKENLKSSGYKVQIINFLSCLLFFFFAPVVSSCSSPFLLLVRFCVLPVVRVVGPSTQGSKGKVALRTGSGDVRK